MTDDQESLEERIGRIVEEEFFEMQDIVEKVIRQKQGAVIRDQLQEELAKDIYQKLEKKESGYAS